MIVSMGSVSFGDWWWWDFGRFVGKYFGVFWVLGNYC